MNVYRELNDVDIAKIIAKYFNTDYTGVCLYTDTKTIGQGMNESEIIVIKAKVVEEEQLDI